MPLRSFGSVSKAELLKQLFAPVTYTNGWSFVNAHPAALIDGGVDQAWMEMRLPPNFTIIQSCILHIIGIANTANMKIDTWADYALPGEANNLHVVAETLNTATVIAQITDVHFALLEAATDLVPNQLLGLTVEYTAAVTATNCYVLGATLIWR